MADAVVTGASGLLGGYLLDRLAAAGHEAEGWSRGTARSGAHALRRVDLRDSAAVARGLTEARPGLIVHCAALTDVDGCERHPRTAAELNAAVPGRLAALAAQTGARFVQISTDAVYDGDARGPHREADVPRPANAYARSKLDGEHAVAAADPGALIVRTTMHGWSGGARPSFSEAILAGLLAGRRLTLFADVTFSVPYAGLLADDVLALAAAEVAGVVNVAARDAVTKAGFGELVAAAFGLDPAPVAPIRLAEQALAAARPRNTALDTSRASVVLGRQPATVRDGIAAMVADLASGWAGRRRGTDATTLERVLGG